MVVPAIAISLILLVGVGASPASGNVSIQSETGGSYLPASISAQSVPTLTIQAPSSAIGDLGANQGNVWDMNALGDIVWRQENFPIYQRPITEGTVIRGEVPQGEDLLSFGLYGSTEPLQSSLYHHLTYRLRISKEGTVGDCRTNGRAALATRFPDWYGSHISTYPYAPHRLPMNCAYGDFCIYYMDLDRNDNYNAHATWHGASSIYDPSPWSLVDVRGFAIVPHEICLEGGQPEFFEVDYVYLTGEIVAREEDDYLYLAKWNVSDPDASSEPTTLTSTLRYQAAAELRTPAESPVCNAGNFNTAWEDFDPIAETVTVLSASGPDYPYKIYLPVISRVTPPGELGPSNASYELDFSDDSTFADGTVYYLCIRVDDGQDQAYAVSSAPVIRAPLPPWFGPD